MEERRDRMELLYDAALEGDVSRLIELVKRDRYILDRCTIKKYGGFTQSPLHVAANLGHLAFTMEILRQKAELAQEIDHLQRSTPLHLAASKGYSEIVRALLAVNPSSCLARDRDGMNPVHVAAMSGELEAFDKLIEAHPQAVHDVTKRGETILHLCVKYRNTTECLEHLVKAVDDAELLNFTDYAGNTILHLAVAAGQLQMVRFLMGKKEMEKNAVNRDGLTAMDICMKMKKKNEEEIKECLKNGNAFSAKLALRPQKKDKKNWIENKRNSLIVVASLIATMAFQVGTNPPGGVWQSSEDDHEVGASVFSDVKKYEPYMVFLIMNTTSLVSSLSVILLLISGLPYNRFFVVVLMVIMWIAISATALTYLFSLEFLLSKNISDDLFMIIAWFMVAWLIGMLLLLLVHVTRFIKKLICFIIDMHHNLVVRATSFRRLPQL